MHETRETDERLKNWLNSNQPARERLCLGLLALDPRYSQIVPRLPEGGPDGKRDMQAVLDKRTVTWGAVGFQNNVSDSDSERRQAHKKFIEDLDGALAKKPDLSAFVFFTNVNLTPTELEQLALYAAARRVTHINIYTRERMRGCLNNSGAGLALRFQYLGITMSDEEQKAFFESFGKRIEELVRSQGENTSEGVKRLEFLHYMSRPLQSLNLHIHLKKLCSADEIGSARAICKMFNTPETDNHGWFIGGEVCRLRPDGGGLSTKSVHSILKEEPQLERVRAGTMLYQGHLLTLYFGVAFGLGTLVTPEAFEGRLVNVYVSKQLVELVERVELILNGYSVVTFRAPTFEKRTLKTYWPDEASEGEWYAQANLMLPTIDFSRGTPPSNR